MTQRPYVSVAARAEKASRAKRHQCPRTVGVGFALPSTPRGSLLIHEGAGITVPAVRCGAAPLAATTAPANAAPRAPTAQEKARYGLTNMDTDTMPQAACIPDVIQLSRSWLGCTAIHGWQEMLTEQLPSLFSPRPIFVNVGANKGYEAPRFLELWSQRESVSPRKWLRGIRAVADGNVSVNGEPPRRNGFLRSQLCGACPQACVNAAKPHARDGGTVHLLEMALPNVQLLRHLVTTTNSSDIISVHHAAVSNESGTAHVQAHVMLGWENAGMLHAQNWRIAKNQATTVEQLTVDGFLERERLPQIVDLLVIDTEGHDPYVLDGMRGALSSKRITLLEFEYSNKWPTDRTLENTLTSLAAHGYKCYMETATARESSSPARSFETLAPISPPCWNAALERRRWSNVVCSHEPRALAMLDAAAWNAFKERRMRNRAVPGSCGATDVTDKAPSCASTYRRWYARGARPSLQECARRCAACDSCRFVSFSAQAVACVLHTACDATRLKQGSGYVHLDVRQASQAGESSLS